MLILECESSKQKLNTSCPSSSTTTRPPVFVPCNITHIFSLPGSGLILLLILVFSTLVVFVFTDSLYSDASRTCVPSESAINRNQGKKWTPAPPRVQAMLKYCNALWLHRKNTHTLTHTKPHQLVSSEKMQIYRRISSLIHDPCKPPVPVPLSAFN